MTNGTCPPYFYPDNIKPNTYKPTLPPNLIRENGPEKLDLRDFSEKSKSRVRRNFNVSPIERLYNLGKINQNQYEAAVTYRQCYYRAYPSQSHQFKEAVDGGGSNGSADFCMAAEDRILNCGKLMKTTDYVAVQKLIIDECEPYQLSDIFHGIRGWSRYTRMKRIRQVLDELSHIWPSTNKKHNI